jgi:hypothetical protein
MSKELNFDGYWEGEAVYTCDCCGKRYKFRFDSEDEAKSKTHRENLRGMGWMVTKVNGRFIDVCSEACRNKYIRNNTI